MGYLTSLLRQTLPPPPPPLPNETVDQIDVVVVLILGAIFVFAAVAFFTSFYKFLKDTILYAIKFAIFYTICEFFLRPLLTSQTNIFKFIWNNLDMLPLVWSKMF
jgi:hypothetical protein